MSDILLDLERLREARTGLRASIEAFSEAASFADGIERAIGRPDDRGALRDKAHDFEGAWNDKRDALAENLQNIEEQLTSIIDGWTEWDSQTAADLEGAVSSTPGGGA
ncbi:flagellar protein FlgN [Microcella flavibacter]|uniref:flagellar protein FlgN n=1 Tax=Microcella flavibacter TaxID=1804990 RepID=UPI00145723FF|nr:flagellar protein FlgN [Microcella flavibacter]